VAQQGADIRYGQTFTRRSTVIIGDSLEDVRTGREDGASVIAAASSTTPGRGAWDGNHVIADLAVGGQVLELIGRCAVSTAVEDHTRSRSPFVCAIQVGFSAVSGRGIPLAIVVNVDRPSFVCEYSPHLRLADERR
jgi:hypothetical protein